MPSAKITHLTDRALIRVAGDEAHHFLQNLVTADLEKIDESGASASALLTPQGKILFDFLIYRTKDGYLVDAPLATAPDLLKRLTFYRLRAKVDLELVPEETGVLAVSDGVLEPEGALLKVADPRVSALGDRIVGPVASLLAESGAEPSSLEAYELHRISLGIPEGLKDYEYSDIFPHDADLDQLGGVSFSKGCYVGQEVVSRVHHRGTSRKRFVLAESSNTLPEKGTPVTAGGKPVGALGSSTGNVGLALVRLDKALQAKENGNPLLCGDAEVQLRIPDWASFSWPEPDTAD